MFSLLSGLWQFFFAQPNLHVLVIGLDHAGKTTLLEKIKATFGIKGVPPERILPTVGMNLAKIKIAGSTVIFWDLGGQLKMRRIWEKYYEEADVIAFVVDSANIERLEEAKLAYDAACDHEKLAGVPILLLANKQDLQGALSPTDLSINFYAIQDAATVTRVFPVSATTGLGLDAAVSAIVEEAQKHCRKTRSVRN